jgi:hypothetical protein
MTTPKQETELFSILDMEEYSEDKINDTDYIEDRISIVLEMYFNMVDVPSKQIIKLANKYTQHRLDLKTVI